MISVLNGHGCGEHVDVLSVVDAAECPRVTTPITIMKRKNMAEPSSPFPCQGQQQQHDEDLFDDDKVMMIREVEFEKEKPLVVTQSSFDYISTCGITTTTTNTEGNNKQHSLNTSENSNNCRENPSEQQRVHVEEFSTCPMMNGPLLQQETTITTLPTTPDYNESIFQILSSYPRDGSLGYGWVKPNASSSSSYRSSQYFSSSVPSFPTSPVPPPTTTSFGSTSPMNMTSTITTTSTNNSVPLSSSTSFITTNSTTSSMMGISASSQKQDEVEQQSLQHQWRLWTALQTHLRQISLGKPHTARLISTLAELARLDEIEEELAKSLPITSSVFESSCSNKTACKVKPLFTSLDDWKAIEREFSDILNLALPSTSGIRGDSNYQEDVMDEQLKTELNRLLMDFEEFLCLLPPMTQCLCDRSQLHCCICGHSNYGFARDLILRQAVENGHFDQSNDLGHQNDNSQKQRGSTETLVFPSFTSTLKGKKVIAEKKKEMKMDLLKKQQQRPENLNSMIMPQFFLHPSSILSTFTRGGNFGLTDSGAAATTTAPESGILSLMNPILSIPSTFCCGVTFEVFFRVFTERGHSKLEDYSTIPELLKIKRDWFCEKQENAEKDDESYKQGCYKALMSRGLGKHVNTIFEAKKGDFIQFWRVNGTGHSVIFVGLKEGETKFEYWSSQRSTNGVGFNTETLSGVERFHIVRLV